MIYDRDLSKKGCTLAFDPMKAKDPTVTRVFENPKARALWLTYRLWHLIDQYGEEYLPKNCLNIAEQIDGSPMMREAVAKWDTRTLSQWLWPRLMDGLHWGSWAGSVAAIPEEVLTEITGEVHQISDSFAYTRYVRPYLTGEKVAEYTVEEVPPLVPAPVYSERQDYTSELPPPQASRIHHGEKYGANLRMSI